MLAGLAWRPALGMLAGLRWRVSFAGESLAVLALVRLAVGVDKRLGAAAGVLRMGLLELRAQRWIHGIAHGLELELAAADGDLGREPRPGNFGDGKCAHGGRSQN